MIRWINALILEICTICKDLYADNYSTQLMTLGLDEITLFYKVKNINLLNYGIIGYNIRYKVKDEEDYVKISDTSYLSYSILYDRLINLYVCLDFNSYSFDDFKSEYCKYSILEKIVYSDKIQFPHKVLYLNSNNSYQGHFTNLDMQKVILKLFYNSMYDNTLDYYRFVNLGFKQLKMLECDICNFDYNIAHFSSFFSDVFNDKLGLLNHSFNECNIKIYCDGYFYSWFKGWTIAFFPKLFVGLEHKDNNYIIYCMT